MIDIDPSDLDRLVKAWLKDTHEIITHNSLNGYVHPDDTKVYKKDLKAIDRLLDYIGR
jgi:hypothetical protein